MPVHNSQATSPAGAQARPAEQGERRAERPLPPAPAAASSGAGFVSLALLAATTAVYLRLVQLDTLQDELYGDIELLLRYVRDILDGRWPFYYSLSSGPLYHYMIAPLLLLTGLTYDGIKLASATASLGVLLGTYALGRRLIDDRFALLAAAVSGVSSWLLIFSRLGNSQILVPLLTALAGWLVVRAAQRGRLVDVLACAVVSALGLYGYPQSIILPGVSFATLLALRWSGHQVRASHLWRFVAATLVCAVPFAWMVLQDPYNFFSGYIGGKAAPADSLPLVLLGNTARIALALHVHGDEVYRSNPPGLPHLDPVSGVLFIAGLVFWLQPARRRLAPALLVPLVLLQVPAMLVLARPDEVPSASRTLGAAPFAYALVASGIWWLARLGAQRGYRRPALALASLLVVAIVALNAQRYFVDYTAGLPYGNTPVGQRVADHADSLPADTHVYIVGCCWAGGMPELPFVQLMAAHPERIHSLEPSALECQQLRGLEHPALLIWSFSEPLPAPQLEACSAWLPSQLFVNRQGAPIFRAAPLRAGQASAQPPVAAPEAELAAAALVVGGQALEIRHSALDMGQAADLFDGDPATLIRGRDANPLVVEVRLPEPRRVSEVAVDLTTIARVRVRLQITGADGSATVVEQELRDPPPNPRVELAVPEGLGAAAALRLMVEDLRARPIEGYHIHVRELELRP